jgi:hypothetical protein
VKTRDHEDAVFDDMKGQPVGKPAQPCAAHICQHRWELQRVGRQALNHSIDFCAQASAQTLRLALVPVLCLDHLGLRSRSEEE